MSAAKLTCKGSVSRARYVNTRVARLQSIGKVTISVTIHSTGPSRVAKPTAQPSEQTIININSGRMHRISRVVSNVKSALFASHVAAAAMLHVESA